LLSAFFRPVRLSSPEKKRKKKLGVDRMVARITAIFMGLIIDGHLPGAGTFGE
jgi:hypothetical protein